MPLIPSEGRRAAGVEGSGLCTSLSAFVLLIMMPALLPAQSGTSGMPELRAMIAAADARIDAICPTDHRGDRSALLTDERRIAATVDGADAATWFRLGCARALLYVNGAISHAGPLMLIGDSWHKGAIRSLLEALGRDPAHHRAAELLGELMLDENVPPERERATTALVTAVDGGVRGRMALRGCTELTRRAGDRAAEQGCARTALDAGIDSTWQLLHLAWAAFDAADTAAGQRLFNGALAAAHDSAAWSEVGWHLRWFLEPDEEASWRTLPDSARAAWVRDHFASRDVRDGRSPGSRMAEHFARLDSVETQFVVHVRRRDLGRFDLAATPESINRDADVRVVEAWYEPGLVPAEPYREFHRWEPRYDDRAVIWMRFGKPLERVRWSSIDSATALGTASNGLVFTDSGQRLHSPGATNTREAWRYEVDGRSLLLSFESEMFSGATEATRLVSGVLGSYFCGIDASRCVATQRSALAFTEKWQTVKWAGKPPPALPPEVVAKVRQQDRELIDQATTHDDNSVRVDHPISMAAELSRVWDPRSGAPLAVIPYAIKVGDVDRTEDSTGVTATLALTLRQWDPGKASWQSTDVIRRLRLPAKLRNSSHLTGYLVTPTSTGVSAWSLVAQQGSDRRGRAWQDDKPALGAGTLRLSDLILGEASQGQTWTTTSGREVPLAPLGTHDRKESVSLYWQVRSAVPRAEVSTRVALSEVGARGEKPAIEVAFTGPLTAGINELQRELGISRLDKGEYRLELTVSDRASGESATRSARLLVR